MHAPLSLVEASQTHQQPLRFPSFVVEYDGTNWPYHLHAVTVGQFLRFRKRFAILRIPRLVAMNTPVGTNTRDIIRATDVKESGLES